MSDFQKHTHHQQSGVDPKTGATKFSEQTFDQSRVTNGQPGGAQTEVQQGKFHQTETQVKETRYAVGDQPAQYTEEARRLDEANKQLDRKIDQIDQKMAGDDRHAHDKNARIEKLETEAEKAAHALNKDQQKHAKQFDKDQAKLQAQEEKTMQMAAKLAEKQAEQQRIQAKEAEEAMRKNAEAHRLAKELAAKREQDRKFAEQKMHELQAAEEAMKNKARELANHQAQEIRELEVKQKDMNVNVEVARKNMEELKRRHDHEKQALDNGLARLEKLRAEAKQARELEDRYVAERVQLEQRLEELDAKAEQERQRANKLLNDHENLQHEIAGLKQDIARDASALRDRDHMLREKLDQQKTVVTTAKTQIQNEEIALKKAEDLAGKTAKERAEAQQDLSRLVGEEQEAKKKVAELDKTINVKVEQKPATVDLYQHTRYETSEPVVTEVNTHEHSKTSEEKSIGGKIVDGVKSLF